MICSLGWVTLSVVQRIHLEQGILFTALLFLGVLEMSTIYTQVGDIKTAAENFFVNLSAENYFFHEACFTLREYEYTVIKSYIIH